MRYVEPASKWIGEGMKVEPVELPKATWTSNGPPGTSPLSTCMKPRPVQSEPSRRSMLNPERRLPNGELA